MSFCSRLDNDLGVIVLLPFHLLITFHENFYPGIQPSVLSANQVDAVLPFPVVQSDIIYNHKRSCRPMHSKLDNGTYSKDMVIYVP